MQYRDARKLAVGDQIIARSNVRGMGTSGLTWHGKITKIQDVPGARRPLILVNIETGDPSWPRLIEVRHDRLAKPEGTTFALHVRQEVKAIRLLRHDMEAAHAREDALFEEVLKRIAAGAGTKDDFVAWAKAALESKKIDFTRACA